MELSFAAAAEQIQTYHHCTNITLDHLYYTCTLYMVHAHFQTLVFSGRFGCRMSRCGGNMDLSEGHVDLSGWPLGTQFAFGNQR